MRFRFLSALLLSLSIQGLASAYADTETVPALERIRQRAAETNSDTAYVLKDGQVVLDYSSGRHDEPIEAMSATKSIVNLAIGLLIDERYLDSVDTPVWKFYPEWKQGKKEQITVRHLLNHTSGLQANQTTEEIYASPDFVQFALAAELSHDPGTNFFYNNKAVNLLAGIVKKASGQRMDRYLNQRLFRRIGIDRVNWSWSLDSVGNPHGMAGLQIKAADLAKLGQLILQKGMWHGRRIISEQWIDLSFGPGSALFAGCGLLWWRRSAPTDDKLSYDGQLLTRYAMAGITKDYIDRLSTIVGQVDNRANIRTKLIEVLGSESALNDFLTQAVAKGVPQANVQPGPAKYFSAEGYLGQYLVIIPEKKIVGVRQIHYQSAGENTQFSDFASLLLQMQ